MHLNGGLVDVKIWRLIIQKRRRICLANSEFAITVASIINEYVV